MFGNKSESEIRIKQPALCSALLLRCVATLQASSLAQYSGFFVRVQPRASRRDLSGFSGSRKNVAKVAL